MKLNLGCGNNIREGWVNLDHPRAVPSLLNPTGAELVGCNLDYPLVELPFDDNTFEEILAQHVLEHIHNLLPLLQELHRIAEPGGKLLVAVPYGSADGAWADPTHVRAFFVESWAYFGQLAYCFADYGYRGDWNPIDMGLIVNKKDYDEPVSKELVLEHILHERNRVIEMRCVLEAIKPIRVPVPAKRMPESDCPIRIVFGEDEKT